MEPHHLDSGDTIKTRKSPHLLLLSAQRKLQRKGTPMTTRREHDLLGDRDVPAEAYDDLVAAGAVPVRSRELVERLVRAGLRRRKMPGRKMPGRKSVEPRP